MTTDTNVSSSIDALATLAKDSSQMATWSDEKKKDYVDLFHKRSNAATYILRNTARVLAHKANEKQFLGTPRYNKLIQDCLNFQGDDQIQGHHSYGPQAAELWKKTYDRSQADMDSIVQERVNSLLNNLPSIKSAMLILDPATAAKMDKSKELRDEGQELADQFEELSVDIRLSDMPEEMTIKEFRQHIKDLETKRRTILERLDAIGKEGQELERQIHKTLFKGLPGIGEEIESVVIELYKQSKDMATTSRDVENTVLYGDCEAALQILETFKTDERAVTTQIGLRFQNGLELLKLKLAKKSKKKTAELNE